MYTWKTKAAFFSLLSVLSLIVIIVQQNSFKTNRPRLRKILASLLDEKRNIFPTVGDEKRNVFPTVVYEKRNVFPTVVYEKRKILAAVVDEKSNHYQSFILSPVFNTTCNVSCNIRKSWQWTMVTFIKSSADNFQRRSFIRRTWGNIRYTESGRFLFVFVTGRPKSNETFLLVQEEWGRYQDILMYDGPDDYRNVVRKTLAGMQWTSENLNRDFFYSSADDDFLLDIAKLQIIVNVNIKQVESFKWPNFPFVCSYSCGINVWALRDKNHKNYLPYDKYKWAKFPRFCYGGFYTTSVETIAQVWNISHNDHALPTDDVWITGILRQKLGMPEYTVVDPTIKAAKHFEGFGGKGDPKSRTFMEKEWAEFYQGISKLPHCLCQ